MDTTGNIILTLQMINHTPNGGADKVLQCLCFLTHCDNSLCFNDYENDMLSEWVI